jgi:general secretion pathway protein C
LNRGGDLPSLAPVRDAFGVRRWTAVGGWLLVVAAAYAGALAVNSAIAFWLDSADDLKLRDTSRSTGAKSEPSSTRTREYSVIFERNLFGSEPIAVPSPGDFSAVSDSGLELRLLGTAQVDGRGYAVLEDVGESREDVFAVGEAIFDGPKLVAVGEGTAEILVGGRKQTLEIANAAAPAPEEHGRERKRDDGGGDGIRKTGANAYLVDRREVEHSVENLNQLSTQMRAVPFIKEGQTIGFRVFNIRANSVFERMGLKNGDVIQKVNGVELDSPTKALALLEDVQTTTELRVDLLRENSPSTLVYTIR